jgi:transposase-like protein
MLQEFDEAVKERRELKEWWSLGETVAKYDHKKHVLRVDVSKPTMIAFCGQEYAGAKNYHDAPDFFTEAVRQAIQDSVGVLTQQAYETELARLTSIIEDNRANVLAELSQD